MKGTVSLVFFDIFVFLNRLSSFPFSQITDQEGGIEIFILLVFRLILTN